MGYREVYTASNMADEEYNISDKGLSITPEILRIQVNPGGIAEGQLSAGALTPVPCRKETHPRGLSV